MAELILINPVSVFWSKFVEEVGTVNLDEMYSNMLDDVFSFESVGGIFANMSPAAVLRECDPTAYRCGRVDYEDSLDLVEIGGNYYSRDDAEKFKEDFLSELEDELNNENEGREDYDATEDPRYKLVEELEVE